MNEDLKYYIKAWGPLIGIGLLTLLLNIMSGAYTFGYNAGRRSLLDAALLSAYESNQKGGEKLA